MSDAEDQALPSPRMDGWGLPQYQEVWLQRGDFISQAWRGKPQSGQYPVYVLTGEQSWGTEDQLNKSCLSLPQVKRAGLHVKRVARSVEPSILAILTQEGPDKPISHNAWLRAIALESGKVYSSFICAKCKKTRRLLPELGWQVDEALTRRGIEM